MTRTEAVKLVREFAIYHAIGDLPYSQKTLEALEMIADIAEKTIGTGRLIDADSVSKRIMDGSGTPLQKFYTDAVLAAEPTVIPAEPKSEVDTMIENIAQSYRVKPASLLRSEIGLEYLPPDD